MVRYSAWYVTDDDMLIVRFFFFFNDTATTEIYTLSLHDALPIYAHQHRVAAVRGNPREPCLVVAMPERDEMAVRLDQAGQHRAAAGVDDGGVARHLHLGRRPRLHDRRAVDQDRGVMNRRHVVAGEQHAADQRQPLRRLRVRTGSHCNDDRNSTGELYAHDGSPGPGVR